MRSSTRFEGLISAFKSRFEKFHLIKYDPYPIINGWIAWWMLVPLTIGFSRLALYFQHPCKTYFKNFNCGSLPECWELPIDSPEMKRFIIELAVRALHIPIKWPSSICLYLLLQQKNTHRTQNLLLFWFYSQAWLIFDRYTCKKFIKVQNTKQIDSSLICENVLLAG